MVKGEKPVPSGHGKWLVIERLYVQIPALDVNLFNCCFIRPWIYKSGEAAWIN